jgi:feruloyl esterase
MYRYLVFDDPDFDYTSYDFENWHADTAAAEKLLSATETDLSALRDAGGKLLFWQGWSDPALTALAMIEYYEAVEARDPDVRDYSRLFLAPGVLHCSGGPGPDRVDLLSAIVTWVEDGVAPERLLASKVDEAGATLMTRPLCPYPEVAVWDGTGDTNDASSFRCQLPDPR